MILAGCSETTPPATAPDGPTPAAYPTLSIRIDSSSPTRMRQHTGRIALEPLTGGASAGSAGVSSSPTPTWAFEELGFLSPNHPTRAATHLTFHPNFAAGSPVIPFVYVTYNDVAGGPGSIDIINVANAAVPSSPYTLWFPPGVNFFSAYVYGTTLYLAGSTRDGFTAPLAPSSLGTAVPPGAFALAITLDPTSGLPSSPFMKAVPIQGHVATDIQAVGDRVYVTSAANGGLTLLSREPFVQLGFTAVADARSVLGSDTVTLVASGMPSARMSRFQPFSTTPQVGPWMGNGPTGADIKGTITEVLNNGPYAFGAMGAQGTMILRRQQTLGGGFAILGYVPVPQIPGVNPADVTTQSVRLYDNYLLSAQGGGGVVLYYTNAAILPPTAQAAPCVVPVGRLTYNGQPFSANFIHGGPQIMYVAMGLGGLRIIRGTAVGPTPTC